MAETLLKAEGLTVLRHDQPIVTGITLDARPGSCIGVIGPNGGGKTSLLLGLRALLPSRGTLLLGGSDPREIPRLEVARRVAAMPQRNEFAFSSRVDEMVLLGRSPYRKPWQGWGDEDREIAGHWLRRLDLLPLADRPVDALSGGERRRVFLARALTQETPLLFLDEPLAGLDPAAQEEISSLLLELHRERSRTIVIVLHDVSRVATLCDHVIGIADGRVTLSGAPDAVLEPEGLEALFGVPWIGAVRDDGGRLLLPGRGLES